MTAPAPSSSASGKWFLFGIGVALAVVGVLFVWLLGRSFLRAKDMKSWPEVSCVILSSEVEQRVHDPQSPPEYRHRVVYGYTWDGESYTGERISLRGSFWSSRPERAGRSLSNYPIGSTQTCHIKPEAPQFSVLETDSLAPGYSIWFPALFVVGGLVISIRSLRPKL